MFEKIKQTKNKTIAFVKENAPFVIPNVIGVAAICFVYSNYTEKQHAAYVNHLDNMDTTYQETMDTLVQHELNKPITE